MRLPTASSWVAVASAASLAMQLALGLLLLRAFAPAVVGEFSVVTQVAFYWTTLALAQGQLKLLADTGQPPAAALRQNLRAALGRWLLLLPVGYLAVHLSGVDIFLAAAWAGLLAFLQVGWYLAQPLTLLLGSRAALAWVRVLPPAVTLGCVGLVALGWPGAGPAALLLAAAVGYAAGWRWLLLARGSPVRAEPGTPQAARPSAHQADDRSTLLRIAHTVADAAAGTAVLLVWQRTHGAVEAGYLAVLLRILGFVPAVTHAAWAQVLLAQASSRRLASAAVGLAAAAMTGLVALGCGAALWWGWIGPAWQGLAAYLVPVACWQAAGCVLAAFAHLPFQQGRARHFSAAAIGFAMVQLALLCVPSVLGMRLAAADHIALVGYASACALLALSAWVAWARPTSPPLPA